MFFRVLEFKPLISLQASRINSGSTFKADVNTSSRSLCLQTQSKTAVHVETIGLQKDKFKKALKHVLPRADKHLHGIEPRFVQTITYLAHDNMVSRLKQVVVKCIHICRNIKQHELKNCYSIYSPLQDHPDFTLRELIMKLTENDG